MNFSGFKLISQKKNLILLFIAWIFFSMSFCVAQKLPTFQTITTQSGLSNNIVYDIHQDKLGYIWMATDHGLNRYDGYEFEIFYHNEKDSTSISSNTVRSIEEDDNGNLWIGTSNGLNLFHRNSKSFSYFTSLPVRQVNRLDLHYMKIDNHGRLWFNDLGTFGWFDTNTHIFKFINTNYKVHSLTVSPEGNAWIITYEGSLNEYKLETQQINNLGKDSRWTNEQIHYGKYSNQFWIKHEFLDKEVTAEAKRLPELPDNISPRVLMEEDSTTLWIGTDAGLYIYDLDKNSINPVDFGNKSSTLSQSIRSIYQDREGGIWVGTLNGIFYFDKYQKQFTNHKIAPNTGDVIMGMGTYKNTVLVNRLGEGLYSYDTSKNSFKKLSFNPKKEINYIWDIQEVPSSEYPLWMATNDELILYQPTSGAWKKITLPSQENIMNVSFSIQPYKNGMTWVASSKRIHLLREKDGHIIKTIPLEKKVVISNIQDLYLSKDMLFIATEGEGIFIYDIKKDQVKSLDELIPETKEIKTASIWDLYHAKNKLWMGTNQGLYCLNLTDNSFEKTDLGTSLSNQIIFSVISDVEGKLWMGTESGLISYNPQLKESTFYGTQDGIENTEFNRKSVLKVGEDLWFGGVQNITAFNPQKIRQNPKIPPVYLTKVNVITADSTFTPNISKNNHITLPWYHNTLEFSYVALNYTNSSQNQYKYRLTDYDPDWIYDKEIRQARYVQLPPGTYDFIVSGANNDSLWNPEPIKLSVKITPPFWKTIWFQGLVVLIIALILWSIYRYRVKKLIEIERIKLRIAGDLHDEIGSGLSGIALTGDVLLKQLDQGKTKPELVSRITKNARTLASLLDAIVWLIDPHKETIEDLIAKSRAVAKELLPETTINIDQKIDSENLKRNLSAEQKRNLFLFIKESIHNVAKHAYANKVEISFIVESGTFNFKIKDNGKGFDQSQNSQGHGLSSMQKRAKSLNATYHLETIAEKGSEVNLYLKLP